MNVLVIGGTGFIGEYLCRELVNQGAQVTTVSLPGLAEDEKISEVKYEKIDLNTNFLELKEIMPAVDAIVLAIQPDILRMKNIISVISQFGSIKKIIYLSTLLVYPNSNTGQKEDVVIEPKTDYEKTKEGEEKLLLELTNDNLSLIILRLGNVYGDVKNRGVVNNILMSLFENKSFILNNGGDNLRDYIFVEDVAYLSAHLISSHNFSSKEVYNICTGTGYSLNQLVRQIEKITKHNVKVIDGIEETKQKSVIGNNQKIVKALNLSPRYNLTEGLVKTYNNYLKHYKFKE